MKRLYLFIVIMLSGIQALGNDTTRVLFIGNSFTYTSDVPGLVKGLADEAGLPFEFVMHAPGGISVGDIDQGQQAHMNNPVVFDLVRSANWDYVVVQDNQGRFSYSYGVFPATTTSKVIEGHIKIMDSVKYYHPCAHMIWFAGWGLEQGHPSIGDGIQMIKNIYGNYRYLNDSTHQIISPIGIAWLRSFTELPQTKLWSSDGMHQSLAGAYLTASVIFSSVFRTNPVTIEFFHNLDPGVARKLRSIAWQSVTDSLVPTNLPAFLPQLTMSGKTLTASAGYTKYDWYQNHQFLATTTGNTYTFSSPDCYQVVVSDNNSCKSRSMEQCVFPADVTGVTRQPAFRIYPNPATDVIHITLNETGEKQLQMTDASGRVVSVHSFVDNSFQLKTDDLPAGIYTITLRTENGMWHDKLVKAN